MRKILVTGANGQLGNEIKKLSLSTSTLEFTFTDIDTLDICVLEQMKAFLDNYKPDLIINCAAYTAVDKAEDEPELAYRINELAVKNLVSQAKLRNIQLIHISTDFVFDGHKEEPYQEDDAGNPISVYGGSKWAGEKIIIENKCGIIIRTSWLYSSFGNNFLKTMLRLGESKNEVSVVIDQIGTPTWGRDLADAIITICQSAEIKRDKPEFGIYHYSNEGQCSWYDFASDIMVIAGLVCNVRPIPTSEYPQQATRPRYSVLDKSKIKDRYKLIIPDWKSSLRKCIEEII